jgi:hypothetical protein
MSNLGATKEHFDNITKFSGERVDKFYSFIRTLLTISSGMIAVLVSLKKDNMCNFDRIIFTSSIGLLSLGILFSAILLYTEIISLRHLEESLTKHTLQVLDGTAKTNIWIEQANPGILYPISKWGVAICFSLSLVLLTVYSY